MSNNKTKRLQPSVLQADQDVYDALKAITDYVSSNPDFTIEKVTDSHDALDAAQALAIQTQAAADAARDALVTQQWDFHEKMLGAKDQVQARYGPNSDQVQSMGRKKKSEYKPRRSAKKGDGTK